MLWDLYGFGIDYFLPLVRMPRRYGGRRVQIELPLFAGYVFVSCVSEDDRSRVLATKRIANMIRVVDQARVRTELEQVRQVVYSPHKVGLYPGIKRGRRFRVTGGCLKGLEGVVLRRSTGRVFLDMAILGQSAIVDVDVMLLEPAD